MEMVPLVSQFDEAMVDIYRRALLEAKYKASRFLSMVQEDGGLATARYLSQARHKQSLRSACIQILGLLP